MALEQHFVDMILDQMSALGDVCHRRMFGGMGLFMDGVMFALISGETLYLKADEQTRPTFDERSLKPFSYTRQGAQVALSYFEAPDDCLEDPDVMNLWCRDAWQAARRTK